MNLLDQYLQVFGQQNVGDISVRDRHRAIGEEGIEIVPLFYTSSSSLKIELEPKTDHVTGHFSLSDVLESHLLWKKQKLRSLIAAGKLTQIRISSTSQSRLFRQSFLIEYYLGNEHGMTWDPEVRSHPPKSLTYLCSILGTGWADSGDVRERLQCAAWGEVWARL
jgi:hypothetical protein